jgi:hypothetical protein
MADYQRTAFPFPRRFNLASPVDEMPPGTARLMFNFRRYGNRVQQRQGIQAASANNPVALPIHSIFSWNDPIPSPSSNPGVYQPHTRLVGVSTSLEIATGVVAAGTLEPSFLSVLDTGYSGNPLTFAVVGNQFNPRPWAFVADINQFRKASSGQQIFTAGIAPPNFAPTAAINAALANGPDIGTTNNPYVYRFRARVDSKINTGCVSNLGPPIRDVNGLSPSSAAGAGTPPSSILVTAPAAHPDPQVVWLDVYRYGGSITNWTYIGTMPNVMGAQLYDGFNDLAIASNELAEFDDNQPWDTLDNSKNGTCNVVTAGPGLGATVTITGGDNLLPYNSPGANPFYPLGNQIAINGTLFTFYRSPDSATSVEILEDTPSLVGATWIMTNPEKMCQALPCIWGPFGGGLTGIFNFAVGDPLRPGAIYWSKGNHPESSPGANVLDITNASEPLMNGCLYSGNSFVFSTNRMWALYPSLGQISNFVALEVPNSKGMFARYALCVTPFGIAFVAKDGIYLTSGGAPTSLTDEDLYPIFPHESAGINGGANSFPVIDGLTVVGGFSPPDFQQPDTFRLTYGDGFIYFLYLDQSAVYRTLVGQFDTSTGKFMGWQSRDDYTPQCSTIYFETMQDFVTPKISATRLLMGTVTGFLAAYAETTFGVDTDFGNAINWVLLTSAFDSGDPRPRKQWGDIEIDLDSRCNTITAQVGFDNFTSFSTLATGSLNLTGRHRVIGDINAGRGQYAYNMGLYIYGSSTSGQTILYQYGPSWLPKPELSALRVTDWTDCGYPGAKFIQGFKLRADTLGVARTVQVLDDNNVAQAFTPTTIQMNGERTIAYSFNTPFISHQVRFAPTDPNFWRIENIEWIYNIAPELVTVWTTQETTHDFEGWLTHRDAYLPLISSSTVTLTVNAIGNPMGPFSYSVPSTAGLYDKIYQQLQAMKCRAVSYSLTGSAGFRVFERDLEVRVKQFGSTGKFLSKQPMGDLSRDTKAKI